MVANGVDKGNDMEKVFVTFTVREFSDLLSILNDQPEWRRRLQRALYPDFDPEAGFRDLAEAIRRLTVMQERFDRDLTGVKQDVSVLKQDMAIVKTDTREIKKDQRDLKGRSMEDFYHRHGTGIFGLYLRKGHDAKGEMADLLFDAEEAGTITLQERMQALTADVIWAGEDRKRKRPVVLVMEASWLAEKHDVERANQRAQILRQVGVPALPIVGGREWTTEAKEAAQADKVITAIEGLIDNDLWQAAWDKWLAE